MSPPQQAPARVGITAVLHTWGSALTHHPHVHMIVPGGGISPDGLRWVSCRPGFFLPVRVLSRCSAGCSWSDSPQPTNTLPMPRQFEHFYRQCIDPMFLDRKPERNQVELDRSNSRIV
jgi:hypothetical protein